jgi:UDP-glucose 4-epimerase
VYGDGSSSRCFTHVSDVVRALVALIDTDAAVGEVFNIGNDEEINILDLAHRIRSLTESKSEIEFVPYSVAYEETFEDMPRRVPCLKKIKRTIGWAPEVPLSGILDSVIDFHQDRVLRTV